MGSRAFSLRALVSLIAVALVGVASCSETPDSQGPGGEGLGQVGLPVDTYGDWSAYGNGQCVIGAQTFYKNKFGVALKPTGVQQGDVGSCAYLGACMYWVSGAAQPDLNTWDRHDWGSLMPQTYDLVIYPPHGTNPYGHVASVDHMEGPDAGNYKNMYIMDSNFNGNELKASAIHTYNLQPYGFYRLKSLAGCAAHCDGNSVVDAKCNKFDCGSVQSACVQDGLGPHCVHPACPSQGDASGCDGASAVTCHDGSITSRDDCGAAGKACSPQGGVHCDAPPRGNLDAAGCEVISGWAQDPSVAEAPAAVHLYFDGPAGDPQAVGIATQAATQRSDLCSTIGSCDHGFVFPTPRSLLDGQPHPVHVYGIDATGGPNVELPGSPMTFQCTAAAPPSSAVWRRIPGDASFALWNFSLFQDVAPLSGEDDRVSTGLVEPGPDLPASPRFVRAEEGGELWLVDSGLRRRVGSETAWHPSTIESWPGPKLYQLPRGGDLPAVPLVVESAGPAYWLLDTPFLPAESTDAPGEPEVKPGAPAGTAQPSSPNATTVRAGGESESGGCSTAPGSTGKAWAVLAALSALRVVRRKRSVRSPDRQER